MIQSQANTKAALEKLADEVDVIAAQISSFKPVLVNINDGNELSPAIYGQLEMVASLSDYITSRLSEMAVELKRLTP